jgi:hypothetical protein
MVILGGGRNLRGARTTSLSFLLSRVSGRDRGLAERYRLPASSARSVFEGDPGANPRSRPLDEAPLQGEHVRDERTRLRVDADVSH